ncbi:MAG: hypothetical protein NZ932_01255 [Candidatus Bathyarchaeota archaeon]|nr:hypothetical protein [Candidatus Bathyarchaeota archaeon]MDW8041020.1 hypothetical protein [Nitrososphaerota archaeon]
MLGFYRNFPFNVHMVAQLTTSVSLKKLQQAIIQALHGLNGESLNLETITEPSIPECTVIFEFGIAESEAFNYLDGEETQKALQIVGKNPLKVMDFFCAVRYYRRREDKNKPLKFDYYMLRLTFNANTVEMQVFHERGPRHISPEEIVNLVVSRVNALFPRKALKPA